MWVTVFASMIYSDGMNAEEWKPIRGPFVRWPRLSDAILALVSFALTIAIWSADRTDDSTYLPFSALVLFVIGNGCLYWRRRFPEHVHGVVFGASAFAILLGYLQGPIFAFAVSLYNLGRYSSNNRNSALGLVAAYALLIASEIAFSGLTSDDFPELLLPFVFWYTGKRLRARGEYMRVLHERAEHLEREQLVEAERAVAAERTRIARELHDIVAHKVSLMTVQAGAAKTVAEADPSAASSAMYAVEVAGRQALDELRHLLGVLRPASESDDLEPQPGRADLPRLVKEIERTGLAISLTLEDSDRRLPARIELAIYRIVQEALTNALKHAGLGTSVEIIIRIDNRFVIVEILDNGRGETRLPGSGHGITGMRERAQSLGGTLETGPGASGGFSVVARIPVSEEIE